MRRFALLSLVFLAGAGAAGGEAVPGGTNDAWAQARLVLPDEPFVIFGANVAAIRATGLFQQLYGAFMAKPNDVGQGLDMLKSTCGIDLKDTVQTVVAALDENNMGAIFIGTRGIDQKVVLGCLDKLATKEKKNISVSGSPPDKQGIVEYTSRDDKKHLYLAYLPDHVVVMATDPSDRGLLHKWLSGQGIPAASATAKGLLRVNTGAALWAVVTKDQDLDSESHMKIAYGHADLGGGLVKAAIHLVLGDEKQAAAAAKKTGAQLAQLRQGQNVPPGLRTVLQTMVVAAERDEMVISASMSEKDLLGMIATALR